MSHPGLDYRQATVISPITYDDLMPAARPPMTGLDITSLTNPRVKHLVSLRRRRVRDQANLTLIEGLEELDLALTAGVRPKALFYSPELTGSDRHPLLDRVAERGADVIAVSKEVFAKVAYRESPDGWLAVVPAVQTELTALKTGTNPLVLICQGVEKPGNLGAIVRTADAAGVTAVIATDPVTDWGNPNVVRASKGTVFSVPVATAATAQVMAWLSEHEIKLIATSPNAQVLLTGADFTSPTAIAVGSEKHGLSADWLDSAEVKVRIPMFGRADSLNVATSAAIVCYEAIRQRLEVRTPSAARA
jgi:TrmH family RNA methyltransferase